MSNYERFLGHIIDYDPKLDVIIIKADFLTPDNQQKIEELLKDKTEFSFFFKKPFKRSKTYAQLKKYFRLLKEILLKANIEPEAEFVRTLDIEIKKSILPCKKLEIGDNSIPIVPSKADLDIDTMSNLIREVIERYGVE
jgi:hypothetical protein